MKELNEGDTLHVPDNGQDHFLKVLKVENGIITTTNPLNKEEPLQLEMSLFHSGILKKIYLH